jgi:hypothetical protein
MRMHLVGGVYFFIMIPKLLYRFFFATRGTKKKLCKKKCRFALTPRGRQLFEKSWIKTFYSTKNV